MNDLLDEVLIALRRILRANSMHSRQLGKSVGLSAPQLMVMRTVREEGRPTASELARAVSLSQATITSILVRLEKAGYLQRERSEEDRRRVHVVLTEAGREVIVAAPKPLQEAFSRRFEALPQWEQHQLVAALQRIAMMMDAENIDAAPLLSGDAEIQ